MRYSYLHIDRNMEVGFSFAIHKPFNEKIWEKMDPFNTPVYDRLFRMPAPLHEFRLTVNGDLQRYFHALNKQRHRKNRRVTG